MLREVGPNLSIDLCEVSAIKRSGTNTAIVYIEGNEFETSVDYQLLLNMINEEKVESLPPSVTFAG